MNVKGAGQLLVVCHPQYLFINLIFCVRQFMMMISLFFTSSSFMAKKVNDTFLGGWL
jgi:hypothetical protein